MLTRRARVHLICCWWCFLILIKRENSSILAWHDSQMLFVLVPCTIKEHADICVIVYPSLWVTFSSDSHFDLSRITTSRNLQRLMWWNSSNRVIETKHCKQTMWMDNTYHLLLHTDELFQRWEIQSIMLLVTFTRALRWTNSACTILGLHDHNNKLSNTHKRFKRRKQNSVNMTHHAHVYTQTY